MSSADSRWATGNADSPRSNIAPNRSRTQSPRNDRRADIPSSPRDSSAQRPFHGTDKPNFAKSTQRYGGNNFRSGQDTSRNRYDRTDIDALASRMQGLHTSDPNSGMKKSKRNWDAEHASLKKGGVQEAPLISRTTDKEDNLLLSTKGQHEMWQHIKDKIAGLSTGGEREDIPQRDIIDQEELGPIIELFRKLREAIFATRWSNNDLIFSIQVFELSSTYCALAGNMGELLKSLKGLTQELYPLAELLNMQMPNRPHYTALYILYHVCYTHSLSKAVPYLQPMKSHPHLEYANAILHSVVHTNYCRWFRLYKQSPSSTYTSLLDSCLPYMQERAVKILATSYYNISLNWAKTTACMTGDDQSVLEQIRVWSGGRIDRIDENQTIWFKRGNKIRV